MGRILQWRDEPAGPLPERKPIMLFGDRAGIGTGLFPRFPTLLNRVVGRCGVIFVGLLMIAGSMFGASSGSRLAYLDEQNPYCVDGDFPKLTTPMWAGEEGVEAAILLSIDDMCRSFPEGRPTGLPVYARQPRVYFDFLKPAIDRLRRIDGRAPISVFCLQLDAEDELVQKMLRFGLSMECHTFTHPVPLMRAPEDTVATSEDSLALARDDFLGSVKSLHGVVGSTPVAHRTPGCDARNTASPRFFTEVFPMKTDAGEFLRMDSSIFMAYTKPVEGLPREWFFHEDGRARFGKFIGGIPFTKTFVNYVENYPYPYVINNQLWELPAAIPGDAHGVHAYKARSPKTVEDWKRAIDITVAKQGLFTLCFHPHGYVDAEQIVELIDYVDRTYGRRVKFLNCREIEERLTRNFLGGEPLRAADGGDNGVRVLDVNADGFLDVTIANGGKARTRVWRPGTRGFFETTFPVPDLRKGFRFFVADRDGRAGIAASTDGVTKAWKWEGDKWASLESRLTVEMRAGARWRDVDGNGVSDLIVNHAEVNEVWLWSDGERDWLPAPFSLPTKGMPVDRTGRDHGLRFVDLDQDGDEDLVYSNETEYGVWLFESAEKGWSRNVMKGQPEKDRPVPPITINGRNNGAWFRSGEMLMVNEFTAKQKDHVIVRRFSDWLK